MFGYMENTGILMHDKTIMTNKKSRGMFYSHLKRLEIIK
ncbi:hypothetical protein SAMN06265348_12420 [Pedobacter westerhofensis]|uniref:Uncharacterized protein n=1 Tax=Pedobacter westerhofensis TaxID=425512 RepID=A0A521FTY1_9SPHI|nr:hypothetical protein SAMN06265348_12420 [Pedobacter westerhofensis]